ncbi:PLP-dependent aminotransferase family protein [Pseudomonas sp. NPDC089407]|uniref:MocR-like pyridoxine biosynthesis transcription factor PdxR n=1 Tax=Pseudomonas sp. NPDC089407 TaxID=3364464 RepID=UPI00384BE18D
MHSVLLTDLLSRSLSKDSAVTLQRQIYEVIRRAVLDHTLVSGQKLPSSRALAAELGISRITISLAYDRLLSEDYLITSTGNGTFVAETLSQPLGAAADAVHTRCSMQLSHRGALLESLPGGAGVSSGAFVPGVADAEAFPFHIWRRLVSRHLGKGDLKLAGYTNNGGLLGLREAVASYLKISRSVTCDPGQVIITSGTHQSVDLCARLLADVGDAALVENPCHWAFPTVLTASGMQVVAGDVDMQGLSVESSFLPVNTKLVVVSPSHHYPTGVVMPLSRRLELLQSARAGKLWILEDDYDSEFRYDGAPLPSLQGLDTDGRVIYIGTFSKAMFAGIRLGYMVVPPHLADAFANASTKLYRSGSLHIQAAVADFIHGGHFHQHIRKMRTEYAARQETLRGEVKRRMGDLVTLSEARAGLHLFARFANGVDYQSVLYESRKQGLSLGLPCFVNSMPSLENRCVVLGFGSVPLPDIHAGVERLTIAVEKSMMRS